MPIILALGRKEKKKKTLVNPILAWVWHESVVPSPDITVTSRNTWCFLLALRFVGSNCQEFSAVLLLYPSLTNLDRVYRTLGFRQKFAVRFVVLILAIHLLHICRFKITLLQIKRWLLASTHTLGLLLGNLARSVTPLRMSRSTLTVRRCKGTFKRQALATPALFLLSFWRSKHVSLCVFIFLGLFIPSPLPFSQWTMHSSSVRLVYLSPAYRETSGSHLSRSTSRHFTTVILKVTGMFEGSTAFLVKREPFYHVILAKHI